MKLRTVKKFETNLDFLETKFRLLDSLQKRKICKYFDDDISENIVSPRYSRSFYRRFRLFTLAKNGQSGNFPIKYRRPSLFTVLLFAVLTIHIRLKWNIGSLLRTMVCFLVGAPANEVYREAI